MDSIKFINLFVPFSSSGIHFFICEMPSIHANNTTNKIPCQPQSVHSLIMPIADNVRVPQLIIHCQQNQLFFSWKTNIVELQCHKRHWILSDVIKMCKRFVFSVVVDFITRTTKRVCKT